MGLRNSFVALPAHGSLLRVEAFAGHSASNGTRRVRCGSPYVCGWRPCRPSYSGLDRAVKTGNWTEHAARVEDQVPRRHAAGETPMRRLNARLNAASDS